MVVIDQTFAALIGTLITAVGIYCTLRLAWKRDKVTEKAGIVTTTGDSVERIMRGFSDLNDSLSKENERYETRFNTQEVLIANLERRMKQEAEECRREIEQLKTALSTAT